MTKAPAPVAPTRGQIRAALAEYDAALADLARLASGPSAVERFEADNSIPLEAFSTPHAEADRLLRAVRNVRLLVEDFRAAETAEAKRQREEARS